MDIAKIIELASQGQPDAEKQLASYLADKLIEANSKEEVAEVIKLLFRIIRKMK